MKRVQRKNTAPSGTCSSEVSPWNRIRYTMWHDLPHDCCFGNGRWSLYAILKMLYDVSRFRQVAIYSYHISFSGWANENWEAAASRAAVSAFFVDLSEESLGSFALLLFPPSCNLVDPASSHMLVSKIKPCMSQNKLFYGKSANGSLKQLYSTRRWLLYG